jgi:hypothetical protein
MREASRRWVGAVDLVQQSSQQLVGGGRSGTGRRILTRDPLDHRIVHASFFSVAFVLPAVSTPSRTATRRRARCRPA